MTTEVRDLFKKLVTDYPEASADDLVKADTPDFAMTSFAIMQLSGLSTEVRQEDSPKRVVVASPSGQTLVAIGWDGSGKASFTGDFAAQLKALLFAIRVHEVDSYEWVYMPSNLRQAHVAERARAAGVSEEAFHRLIGLWARS